MAIGLQNYVGQDLVNARWETIKIFQSYWLYRKFDNISWKKTVANIFWIATGEKKKKKTLKVPKIRLNQGRLEFFL